MEISLVFPKPPKESTFAQGALLHSRDSNFSTTRYSTDSIPSEFASFRFGS